MVTYGARHGRVPRTACTSECSYATVHGVGDTSDAGRRPTWRLTSARRREALGSASAVPHRRRRWSGLARWRRGGRPLRRPSTAGSSRRSSTVRTSVGPWGSPAPTRGRPSSDRSAHRLAPQHLRRRQGARGPYPADGSGRRRVDRRRSGSERHRAFTAPGGLRAVGGAGRPRRAGSRRADGGDLNDLPQIRFRW